jgi:ATP-dependent Clp protease adaptor protein ClpS
MPATLTPPDIGIEPGSLTEDQDQLTPLYHCVLLDDDDHTYEYVIEMLGKLFLISEAQGNRHAVEVDTLGRTIVITCELPQAEFARDQIHGYGADYRMPESKGSMRAIVEPATKGGKG